MISVSAKPSQTFIRASVVNQELAEDGWGAWADLRIEAASDPDLRSGDEIRVFVPPPLVAKVARESRYEGSMTYRRGREGGFFSLVPVKGP
jgi:hypothetical protein